MCDKSQCRDLKLLCFVGIVIDFQSPSYTVNERDGTAEVCVELSSGSLQRTVVAFLSTANGTALGKFYIVPLASSL